MKISANKLLEPLDFFAACFIFQDFWALLGCPLVYILVWFGSLLKSDQCPLPLSISRTCQMHERSRNVLSQPVIYDSHSSLGSERKWGHNPLVDNGMLNGRTKSSSTTSNHTPDQLQR